MVTGPYGRSKSFRMREVKLAFGPRFNGLMSSGLVKVHFLRDLEKYVSPYPQESAMFDVLR